LLEKVVDVHRRQLYQAFLGGFFGEAHGVPVREGRSVHAWLELAVVQ
jgi:hypothetical protein